VQPILIVLIGAIALSFGLGAYAVLGARQRRVVLDRAADSGVRVVDRTLTLAPRKTAGSVVAAAAKLAPSAWTDSAKTHSKLIQAGYDSETAPVTYAAIRIGMLVTVPLLLWAAVPNFFLNKPLLAFPLALYAAFITPVAILDRKARERQDRIRKAIPDALDLLIVCVEAGSSLDSSLLRVAREMKMGAADLSSELLVVNRKMNAGMRREEALRGLANRTGLSEIRALVSSMIQSEKWGTSISQVLRVNADDFRRRRRQAAEKRAQQAPVKMILPLVLFILPALFAVILGPAAIQIGKVFGGTAGQ
jgi:tight adherence protein C